MAILSKLESLQHFRRFAPCLFCRYLESVVVDSLLRFGGGVKADSLPAYHTRFGALLPCLEAPDSLAPCFLIRFVRFLPIRCLDFFAPLSIRFVDSLCYFCPIRPDSHHQRRDSCQVKNYHTKTSA